jgi:ribosome modulation factor
MAERARASVPKKRSAKSKAKAPGNGAGHNSRVGLPSGGPPAEVKLRWLSKVDTAGALYDRAAEIAKKRKSELGNIYAGAKDDGCDIDALKVARKLHKRAHADVAAEYSATGDWLRLMHSPLAEQLELFKTPDWPEPVNANLAGYRVGRAGGSVDECEYQPGSETFASWRVGYDLGQEENRESLRNA